MPIALGCLGRTKVVPRASERRTIGDRQIGFATTMRGPFPQRFCRERCPDSRRAKTSGTGCQRNAARGEVRRLGGEILFCGLFERSQVIREVEGGRIGKRFAASGETWVGQEVSKKFIVGRKLVICGMTL
jgi:hypothetical protein